MIIVIIAWESNNCVRYRTMWNIRWRNVIIFFIISIVYRLTEWTRLFQKSQRKASLSFLSNINFCYLLCYTWHDLRQIDWNKNDNNLKKYLFLVFLFSFKSLIISLLLWPGCLVSMNLYRDKYYRQSSFFYFRRVFKENFKMQTMLKTVQVVIKWQYRITINPMLKYSKNSKYVTWVVFLSFIYRIDLIRNYYINIKIA